MLDLCEYIIRKSDRHKRVAVENAMKFNDLRQSFLCDNHLENKFINHTFCKVFFLNAQKLVSAKRSCTTIERKGKRSDNIHDWNKVLSSSGVGNLSLPKSHLDPFTTTKRMMRATISLLNATVS